MRRRHNIFGLSKNERMLFKLTVVLIGLDIAVKVIIKIIELAIEYWPAIACILIVFIFIKQVSHSNCKNDFSLAKVDKISNIPNRKEKGTKFEKYLGKFFESRNYTVIITPQSGDKGADLIIEKNGVRTAVQAKCHKDSVDHKSVQEVYCSLNYYKCKGAIVITNSHFTKTAKELARSNNVELWDRERLGNEFSKS